MARKKKSKKHEEHIDESWLLPYSDLLTLLLALFIVLFCMSTIDSKKFDQMSSSFRSEFVGGTGVLVNENSTGFMEGKDSGESDENQKYGGVNNKIEEYIEENDLEDKLKSKMTEEGLVVTILDDIMFDSGSATVRKKDEKFVREVSELLVMDLPRSVIISGHTDNVPMKNSTFGSNWELSVMRAINFMKILMENHKLDPKVFSAKGYGEYLPVATNDTAVGRQKNRRVEILIIPNEDDLSLPSTK